MHAPSWNAGGQFHGALPAPSVGHSRRVGEFTRVELACLVSREVCGSSGAHVAVHRILDDLVEK